ncbi:hypothetical protein MTR67_034639 [Solanum verrucosum]|uniref:Uncharacterized protein n=1 Tax=Solanum verrucosum TaxID=315347 RepID=A0AAF0ZLH8_SOLVR|nr:hypothetical protein MTR67_034639 [Solanum verrucosum]
MFLECLDIQLVMQILVALVICLINMLKT